MPRIQGWEAESISPLFLSEFGDDGLCHGKWGFITYHRSSYYLKWYWLLIFLNPISSPKLSCVWTKQSYSLSNAHMFLCKCFDVGWHRRVIDFKWDLICMRSSDEKRDDQNQELVNIKIGKAEVKLIVWTWNLAFRALYPPPKLSLGSDLSLAGQHSQDCFPQLRSGEPNTAK